MIGSISVMKDARSWKSESSKIEVLLLTDEVNSISVSSHRFVLFPVVGLQASNIHLWDFYTSVISFNLEIKKSFGFHWKIQIKY